MSISVSRETQDKLDLYAALLVKWQAKINLVSPNTLADAKTRHFDDSIQILPLLKESDKVLVDLGSGAGFPGLALAIARPDMAVHLVESDAKKCEFMRAVSRETKTPVTLHNSRIEATPPFIADVMTARALAPLNVLLAHALDFVAQNKAITLLFMKGANWQDEVRFARELYHFDMEAIPSVTASDSVIIKITGLTTK